MKGGYLLLGICLIAGLIVMSTGCDKLGEFRRESATETKPAVEEKAPETEEE